MPKLDRDGVKIHYEIHGSGPTLLLSHGYSSTARMWDGQVAALKDRYQVIVWDMRGHPERVRALMLFDTGPGFKKDEARARWNETAHQRAATFDAKGLAALNSSDEVKLTRHRDATGLAGAARGMLAQQNDRVIQSLDKVAVPTLVLVGANDNNFLAATDYMAGKIKGATKAVIPDAGHASNLHQPARFNQAVEAFLAKLPAA